MELKTRIGNGVPVRDALPQQYFQGLFTTSNSVNMETILDSVEQVITPTMNYSLLKPYTLEEVRQAVFQMHPSKSPDPDGMPLFFFLEILAYC